MLGTILGFLGPIAGKLVGSHLVANHRSGTVPNSLESLLVGMGSRAMLYIVLGMCLVNEPIRGATEHWFAVVGEQTGLQLWGAVKGIFRI